LDENRRNHKIQHFGLHNLGQNLDEKWPPNRIDANFVGLEVLKPSEYFYLGEHPAMYFTTISM